MTGILITFEGIEGAGKSTQIAQLDEALIKEGIPHLLTREPGGSPIGEQIREIILDKRNHMMSPKTELLLYLSSRAQHMKEVIEPALMDNQIVITDRFSDATLAYQGYGRGEDLEKIKVWNHYLIDNKEPQITFLLDIDVSTGLSRVANRKNENRLDQEALAFHQRVREGYLILAKENPRRIHILSGAKKSDVLHQEVMEILRPHLEKHKKEQQRPS